MRKYGVASNQNRKMIGARVAIIKENNHIQHVSLGTCSWKNWKKTKATTKRFDILLLYQKTAYLIVQSVSSQELNYQSRRGEFRVTLNSLIHDVKTATAPIKIRRLFVETCVVHSCITRSSTSSNFKKKALNLELQKIYCRESVPDYGMRYRAI